MKRQLKLYFKKIKNNLPCYNKAMQKMLSDLKASVNTFIEENNVTDFKIIEKHFGNAEDIAKEFAIGVDDTYIESYRFKKRAVATVLSILAAITIAVSALVIYVIATLERNRVIDIDTNITYEYKEEYEP